MPETIADRLRRTRQAKGIRLKQVAAVCGVSPSTANAWELDQCRIYAAHVAPVAELLGVSVDWLLTGRETPQHAALLAAVRRAGERGTRDPILAAMLRYAP